MEHLLLVVQSERDQHRECPSTPPRAKKARTHTTPERNVPKITVDAFSVCNSMMHSANIVDVVKAGTRIVAYNTTEGDIVLRKKFKCCGGPVQGGLCDGCASSAKCTAPYYMYFCKRTSKGIGVDEAVSSAYMSHAPSNPSWTLSACDD